MIKVRVQSALGDFLAERLKTNMSVIFNPTERIVIDKTASLIPATQESKLTNSYIKIVIKIIAEYVIIIAGIPLIKFFGGIIENKTFQPIVIK